MTGRFDINKILTFNGTILVFVILVFLVNESIAQDENENQVTNQFWFDFNPSHKISEKVGVYGSVGFRTISPHAWNRYWLKPAVKYKRPKFMLKKLKYKEELHGGIEMYFTDNKGSVDRLEISPFQAYQLSWPNRTRIEIKHFVKLEERFEIETDDWINTFGLRLSYEASLIIKFQGDVWNYGKGFYIPVSAKFYWNLIGTKQFNDKVRIMPGIGYNISPVWKVVFLVGYNYARNTVEDDFHTNDIIYRLRVYYKIN